MLCIRNTLKLKKKKKITCSTLKKKKKKKNCNRAKRTASPIDYRDNKHGFSKKKKNQTPIHSKSLNQIRNFGPYCPLQPAVDDRRSDFSKSVHSGTKTLSPFLLTRTVVFSFLLLRFLWVDEVFFYLVKAFIA